MVPLFFFSRISLLSLFLLFRSLPSLSPLSGLVGGVCDDDNSDDDVESVVCSLQWHQSTSHTFTQRSFTDRRDVEDSGARGVFAYDVQSCIISEQGEEEITFDNVFCIYLHIFRILLQIRSCKDKHCLRSFY